jgi:hypothetical protein
LSLLGKCSTTWIMPLVFFVFTFSHRVSYFCLGSTSDQDPPTSAFWVVGATGVYHHVQQALLFSDSLSSLTWWLRNHSFYFLSNWNNRVVLSIGRAHIYKSMCPVFEM